MILFVCSFTVSIPDNKMPKNFFSIKIELLSLEKIEKWTKVTDHKHIRSCSTTI